MVNKYRLISDDKVIGVAWLKMVNARLYFLSYIEVFNPYRHKGYGRKLLNLILEDAEKERVHIELKPDSSGKMSQAQLVNWYISQGFHEVEGKVLRY